MDLKEELAKYKDLVNKELQKYVITADVPEKILNQSAAYSLMAGGKRLRPILMLSTYKLFKEDYEVCFPFAVAMEMIHNFSLIHDDLPAIDNDDFRHGIPTNHKKFNEQTAILAGDLLLNYAYMVVSKELLNNNNVPLENKLKAFHELSYATDRMIAGEYVDTEFQGKEISNDYLEYMHMNKTAALLRACVRIGAILASAEQKDIDNLTTYAEKIGLAFQIKDDILSETADEAVLGKPVGHDSESEKCTFVTKYGLEKSKQLLAEVTDEAIEIAKKYDLNDNFFEEFTIYLRDREK